MKQPTTYRTAILLLLLHITSSNSVKNAASPVYEVNEQARMDDKRTGPQTFTPYGNPLAGNSLQNAKIHAQHQQAMFNAERVRQHRAQLQRWTKIPPHSPQTDSYMKAYHESQESHQLAIEQQQAGQNENRERAGTPSPRQRSTVTSSPIRQRQTTATSPPSRQRQRQNIKRIKPTESSETMHTIEQVSKESQAVTNPPPRQRTRPNLKRIRGPDPMKITIEDAVLTQKNRNHRSYGSVEYQQHLIPKRYKTVYVSPGPTYDQGVTIKPNGNVGLTHLLKEEPGNLYTDAIPSKYVYPKQFNQMQNYESAQDIAALNSLLKKEPQDQVNELNALLHSDKNKDLETPIDLYFYLKDQNLAQQYSQSLYGQETPQKYASAYVPQVKDHIPITEQVDDVEDPNKFVKKPFTAAPTKATEDMTTNLNYYQIDPTIATKSEFYLQEEDQPDGLNYRPEALRSEKPLTFYSQPTDESERYLHHNGQTGVQHLNQDGTGVSAYGDDDVSISKRKKRSLVGNQDTDPFVLSDNLTSIDANETLPVPEELRRRQVVFKNDIPFLASQNYAIDDSFDEYEYDETDIPNDNNDDYNLEYDDNEYEPNDNPSQPYTRNQMPGVKPPNYISNHRMQQNSDSKGSYSQRFGNRHVHSTPLSYSDFTSYSVPITSYGVPSKSYGIPSTSYGVPTSSYGVPEHVHSLNHEHGVPKTPDVSSVVNSLEPVYMLTQSQLKSLVGHHNLNIQHLDVFQWQNKSKMNKRHRPRKYRKKYRRPSHRNVRKNLSKLHKLTIL